MLELSLQLSITGQSIWTGGMACFLQELRRYTSELKGLARMDLKGMSTVVANLNQTTKKGLPFNQGYLSNNRPNQFHYIICLLPEFR